jgi:hypothetical protein
VLEASSVLYIPAYIPSVIFMGSILAGILYIDYIEPTFPGHYLDRSFPLFIGEEPLRVGSLQSSVGPRGRDRRHPHLPPSSSQNFSRQLISQSRSKPDISHNVLTLHFPVGDASPDSKVRCFFVLYPCRRRRRTSNAATEYMPRGPEIYLCVRIYTGQSARLF